MIRNDTALRVTLEWMTHFQQQVARLRRTENNPVNYRLSVAGFLAEIDRMNLEVRECLAFHPSEAGPMEVGQQPPYAAAYSWSRTIGGLWPGRYI